MDKSEKEEKFEEAATARDRILKLKKIENKKIIQELKLKHEEEISYYENIFNNEVQSLDYSIETQLTKIKENKEKAVESLELKHEEEKEKLIEEFESSYPNEPKFSSEVLNLKKIMDGHIKNREYEKANEIKIKIINLCGEQDDKHKSNEKERKLNYELKKLKTKQSYELNTLIKKWNLTYEEFRKKGNKEKDKLNLKYKNKIMDTIKIQKRQLIEQEKLNTKNLVIKPANISKK